MAKKIKVEIYQDKDRAKAGVQSWTFSVDGQPSGMWCPTEYAAHRVVTRLEQGRSGEAFGRSVAVAGDRDVRVAEALPKARGRVVEVPKKGKEKVALGSGKEKEREAKPSYKYVLDGKESADEYPTEAAAREACAFAAFMTRGKLGRLAEVEEAVKADCGEDCKAAYDGKAVTVKTKSGKVYVARVVAGEPVRVKQANPEDE